MTGSDQTPLVDYNDATRHPEAPPKAGPLGLLEQATEWIALLLFIAMMLVTLFQVIARYSFIAAIWTEELARILFVAASLLAIAVCVRRREHIIVDYLLDKMPPARRQRVMTLMDVLILVFLLFWLRGAITLFFLNAGAVYVTIPWIKVSYLFGVEIVAIVLMILFVAADLAARSRAGGRRP